MNKSKIILTLAMLALLVPANLQAQNSDAKAISVTPFIEELGVAKGESMESYVKVTNETDRPLSVTVSTKDFLPGDRGEPQFVPDKEFNEITFSLASWITLPGGSSIELGAKESKDVAYKVSPPANAEQGTHYGALLFSYAGGDNLAGVGITQSVGTIVLVEYGQARAQGENIFSVNKKYEWWNAGFEFSSKFTNTGNVHVKPKGEIDIKNIFGKSVASVALNRDAASVLPKSDRVFVADWFPGRFSFGPYKAELITVYGREKLEVRNVQTIWILPLYILAVILLIVILILWFVLHGRHWYRRRVVSGLDRE